MSNQTRERKQIWSSCISLDQQRRKNKKFVLLKLLSEVILEIDSIDQRGRRAFSFNTEKKGKRSRRVFQVRPSISADRITRRLSNRACIAILKCGIKKRIGRISAVRRKRFSKEIQLGIGGKSYLSFNLFHREIKSKETFVKLSELEM